MVKSIFEKWEDIKGGALDKEGSYIINFYLGHYSKANMYLGMFKNKQRIYLEFDKDVLDKATLPNIKGMDISIQECEYINSEKQYIQVENVSQNEEIFMAFSSSLADELANAKSYQDTYEKFICVVKEYKDYFANTVVSLSKSEEQGLCAELLELKNLIQIRGESIVKNWQGPSKNKRDFVFNNTALEIKSTSQQTNSSIQISNENQLNNNYPSELKKLFIKVYIMETVDEGLNVNSCISDIENLINNVHIKSMFYASLLKLKIDHNIYNSKFSFKVQEENVYVVDEKFPKLTRENISTSIYDVTYRVKLDGIKDYIIEEEKMNEQLQ